MGVQEDQMDPYLVPQAKFFFEKIFDVPVGRLMFHCIHGGYVSAGATRLLLRRQRAAPSLRVYLLDSDFCLNSVPH